MKRSLYDQMLAFSTEPRWFVWPDGLVTASQSRPTRDELIEGYMSIPHYVCTRDANGRIRQVGPTYASRDEAERSADAYASPSLVETTENAA